ncbi:hypothetical protein DTO271G3_7003 [Paecilomyces variotii]|nr:hypothetical protein DTO271G3_7003 [Paecilomyces variotii]
MGFDPSPKRRSSHFHQPLTSYALPSVAKLREPLLATPSVGPRLALFLDAGRCPLLRRRERNSQCWLQSAPFSAVEVAETLLGNSVIGDSRSHHGPAGQHQEIRLAARSALA